MATSVFLRGSTPVLVVSGIERIHGGLTLGTVFDQLDERVLLVVLRVNLAVHGSQALCGSNDGVFIDRHIGILLAAGLRSGSHAHSEENEEYCSLAVLANLHLAIHKP